MATPCYPVFSPPGASSHVFGRALRHHVGAVRHHAAGGKGIGHAHAGPASAHHAPVHGAVSHPAPVYGPPAPPVAAECARVPGVLPAGPGAAGPGFAGLAHGPAVPGAVAAGTSAGLVGGGVANALVAAALLGGLGAATLGGGALAYAGAAGPVAEAIGATMPDQANGPAPAVPGGVFGNLPAQGLLAVAPGLAGPQPASPVGMGPLPPVPLTTAPLAPGFIPQAPAGETVAATEVPEPGSLVLLLGGGLFAVLGRRRHPGRGRSS